jgi:hypothetical protein
VEFVGSYDQRLKCPGVNERDERHGEVEGPPQVDVEFFQPQRRARDVGDLHTTRESQASDAVELGEEVAQAEDEEAGLSVGVGVDAVDVPTESRMGSDHSKRSGPAVVQPLEKQRPAPRPVKEVEGEGGQQ